MVVIRGVGATACVRLARLALGRSIRRESSVLWVPCTPERASQARMLINTGESTCDATVGLTGGHWDTHVDLAAAAGQVPNVLGQMAAAEAMAAMLLSESPVAVDLEDVSAAMGTGRVIDFASYAAYGHDCHVRAAREASGRLRPHLANAAGVLVSISTRADRWCLAGSKAALNAVRRYCRADGTVIYGLELSSNLRQREVLVTIIAAGRLAGGTLDPR